MLKLTHAERAVENWARLNVNIKLSLLIKVEIFFQIYFVIYSKFLFLLYDSMI